MKKVKNILPYLETGPVKSQIRFHKDFGPKEGSLVGPLSLMRTNIYTHKHSQNSNATLKTIKFHLRFRKTVGILDGFCLVKIEKS